MRLSFPQALLACILLFSTTPVMAQTDSLQFDPSYNRPVVTIGGTNTAVGGYLDFNSNAFTIDGKTDGFSLEMHRFNLFFYSNLTPQLRMLAEVEYEYGGQEIKVETAFLDFEIRPELIVRGGMILAPMGLYNPGHDGPRWEFIEKPLSTKIIPSTHSESALGLHGKFLFGRMILGYEGYIVNGLQDGIITNSKQHTSLPDGRAAGMFKADNNGSPAFTGRVSLRHKDVGELGASYYGGAYNSYKKNGEKIDDARGVSLAVIDASLSALPVTLQGEIGFASITLPASLPETFGSAQMGAFVEAVWPFLTLDVLGFTRATVNAALRVETADYNTGTFAASGSEIFDDVRGFNAALSFRPRPTSVVTVNYLRQWTRTVAGNETAMSGWQIGISSYF